MFLKLQISILEWFLKDHVTLLFATTEINYILKYIYIEKSYLMCNISQYYWLLNSYVFLQLSTFCHLTHLLS